MFWIKIYEPVQLLRFEDWQFKSLVRKAPCLYRGKNTFIYLYKYIDIKIFSQLGSRSMNSMCFVSQCLLLLRTLYYSGIKMITWVMVEASHHLPEYKLRNQITANISHTVNFLTKFLKQHSSMTRWQIPIPHQ